METGAVYSDFGQLASLRADAAANPNAALDDVARQFESIFIQMMLKSMRDATPKSELFGSNQMDTYMSMADQQISLSLSENGGIGIARMLVEQMQAKGLVPASTGGESLTAEAGAVQRVTDLSKTAPPMAFQQGQALKAYELPVANQLMTKREG